MIMENGRRGPRSGDRCSPRSKSWNGGRGYGGCGVGFAIQPGSGCDCEGCPGGFGRHESLRQWALRRLHGSAKRRWLREPEAEPFLLIFGCVLGAGRPQTECVLLSSSVLLFIARAPSSPVRGDGRRVRFRSEMSGLSIHCLCTRHHNTNRHWVATGTNPADSWFAYLRLSAPTSCFSTRWSQGCGGTVPSYLAWALSGIRMVLASSSGTVLAECFIKSWKTRAQHGFGAVGSSFAGGLRPGVSPGRMEVHAVSMC